MIRTAFFTASDIAPQMQSLQALRIAVFRAWPYLYDGAMPSEADTLTGFAVSPTAGIAVAFDGETPVGASTCIHLPEEDDHITLPFREAGIDLVTLCYFGESVLLPAYRGQGIGVRFFELREAHARMLPGVTTTAFCAVERAQDHPLRPVGAVPLDAFWRKRDYQRTELSCQMSWKQVDTEHKVSNTLRFWTKALT